MKTESEIRQMLAILDMFNSRGKRGGIHDNEIKALMWVLGEWPPAPKPKPEPEVNAPLPNARFRVEQSPYRGGFPVRRVPEPKKEGE